MARSMGWISSILTIPSSTAFCQGSSPRSEARVIWEWRMMKSSALRSPSASS